MDKINIKRKNYYETAPCSSCFGDVVLTYDEIDYNDKGQLVLITGSMTSSDGSKSRFVASDFEMLILAMIKKSDKTFFKVSTKDQKEVI